MTKNQRLTLKGKLLYASEQYHLTLSHVEKFPNTDYSKVIEFNHGALWMIQDVCYSMKIPHDEIQTIINSGKLTAKG